MKPVIIDTSGWIEFFNKPESKIGDSVAKLIETDNAIIIRGCPCRITMRFTK